MMADGSFELNLSYTISFAKSDETFDVELGVTKPSGPGCLTLD